MDWAFVSKTLTHLETLDPDEVELELERLKNDNPDLRDQVEGLRKKGEVARSFMQTRMADANSSQSSSMKPGDRVGIWQIDSLLGAGGMGEVYEAQRADGLFEQRVALKLARNADKRLAERFEAERNRLAQLEHPNIARIVDGGTSESGAPYMTMEFVDGLPIDAHVQSARLGREQRLRLIVRLCEALSHAHGRLVLHRDIKHDNVLINADGELRLIDFGVASLLDDPDAQQERGPLTIAYAAPEQLLGNPVSSATDIFAVGMLTHLLETGSLPTRRSDGGVAVDAARIGDADLAAILAKATASNPAQRYGSADALGDDLEKWLGGFPVTARKLLPVERARKLVARNKLASAMSAAAIVAVVVGVIGVGAFAIQADEARAEAELRVEAAEYYLEESMLTYDVAVVRNSLAQQYLIEDQGLDEADYRAFLIEKAEEAQSTFSANPEASAALMFSVAEYANQRGDYAKSSELAQFILDQDELPEIREMETRLLQARNLRELGQSDAAEQESRSVLAWMRTKSFLFETQGYAGLAANLALNSLREDDLREAVRANLREATAPKIETDQGNRAYAYNNLGVLSSKLGEYDKTIEYAIQAVELSKSAESVDPISVNTRSLNLIGYILQHKQDVEMARQYWPREEDVMDPEKGHLRHRSMHRLYEAYAFQIEGDHAAAFEKAKLAHELAEEQYPPGSPYHVATLGMVIETGAFAGKTEEVRALLESMMMSLESDEEISRSRAMITRAFLLNAEGKRDEAIAQYEDLDRETIATNLDLTYKLGLLERQLGVS